MREKQQQQQKLCSALKACAKVYICCDKISLRALKLKNFV